MRMTMREPDIYNYNDFRNYLADFRKYHYARDKRCSKSSLSKLLDLPNTRRGW